MVSRVSDYEFTSWSEYLGREEYLPLCNVQVVLGRISIDELTALVEKPLDEEVSCIDYEEERIRSMSDDSVMLCLKEEFGISDDQQFQKLCKKQRDSILAALLKRRAGVRQLQRLTGIGKNIISNVSKKYMYSQDTDLSPCPSVLLLIKTNGNNKKKYRWRAHH